MGCGRELRGGQPIHHREIGLQPVGELAWHRRPRNLSRLIRPAIHRQYHRARPPCSAILCAQQRPQHLHRTVRLPRYAKRNGYAPRQFS